MLWLTQQQLRSKKTHVRRKAIEQMGRDPQPRSFAIFQQALEDSDAEVRRLAVVALGKLQDERGPEILLRVLRDADPEVVKAAISCLKQVRPEKTLAALTPLLRHEDGGVRAAAGQALESLGWQPASREDESWFLVAKGQFQRVVPLGAVALPALELAARSEAPTMGAKAIEALGYIGDHRALRPLTQAIKSCDAPLCLAAVDALCRLGEKEALDHLIQALQHKIGQVRMAAVDGLGKLRATPAFDPICDLLKGDPMWEVRREAANALGRMGDPRAQSALAEALNDKDADVREAAAMALGNLGNRSAITPLVLALKDEQSGVRRIAAAALSRIDFQWPASPEAAAAVEGLKPALLSDDPAVKYSVTHLLVTLGAIEPAQPLGAAVQEMLPSAASRRHKMAVQLFISLLDDRDRDLRLAATVALGRLKDDRAHTCLMHAQDDADLDVRLAAETALAALAAKEPS